MQTIIDAGARSAWTFLESCTPGYYNNEGKPGDRGVRRRLLRRRLDRLRQGARGLARRRQPRRPRPRVTLDRASLDAALRDAVERAVRRRPAAQRGVGRARRGRAARRQHALGRCTSIRSRSAVERAEGRYLYDVDRHRYVDLLGNYTAGLLGHSPPAVARRAPTPRSTAGGRSAAVHPNEALLGELIVGRFPSIEQVRFTNSGTEANLMALALAIHHTGRRKVMVFHDGYHGGVLTFGHGGEAVTVPHDCVMAATTTSTGSPRRSPHTATTSRPCSSSRCRVRPVASRATPSSCRRSATCVTVMARCSCSTR